MEDTSADMLEDWVLSIRLRTVSKPEARGARVHRIKEMAFLLEKDEFIDRGWFLRTRRRSLLESGE